MCHGGLSSVKRRVYLLRLAEKNGYPSPRWLSQLEPMLIINSCGEEVIEALARITGFAIDMLKSLTCSLGPNELHARFVSPHARVCQECLKESNVIDAVWDVAFACCCPYHGILLIDTCPKCNKLLSWDRRGVARCNCGADITTAPAIKAQSHIILLNARIWAAAGRPIFETGPINPIEDVLSGLNLEQLCMVYLFLAANGKSLLSLNGAKPINVIGAVAALDIVNSVLNAWPSGFHQMLEDNCAKGEGLERAFGRQYRYLYGKFSGEAFFFSERHSRTSSKQGGMG
jgi:hypothetical protein